MEQLVCWKVLDMEQFLAERLDNTLSKTRRSVLHFCTLTYLQQLREGI